MDMAEAGLRTTGAILSAARQASGIDLIDIAKETRVPLRHLRAIESDQHDSLPALPYAIGFVKTFARAVGLDPETVASQFRSETSKVAHVPSAIALEPLDERRLPSRGLVTISIVAIVMVIAGLWAWGAGAFDPAPQQTDIAVEAPAQKQAQQSATAGQEAPPLANAVAPDVGTGAAGALPSGVASTLPNGLPSALPDAPAVAGAVVLTAKEDVWVKIYNGATRTSARIGIMKAGESYAVPADQPGLLLWTGKAGAIAITVAGRAIPPLGGPVETVRDVNLDAASLLARSAPAVGAVTPPAGVKPGVGPQTFTTPGV